MLHRLNLIHLTQASSSKETQKSWNCSIAKPNHLTTIFFKSLYKTTQEKKEKMRLRDIIQKYY